MMFDNEGKGYTYEQAEELAEKLSEFIVESESTHKYWPPCIIKISEGHYKVAVDKMKR